MGSSGVGSIRVCLVRLWALCAIQSRWWPILPPCLFLVGMETNPVVHGFGHHVVNHANGQCPPPMSIYVCAVMSSFVVPNSGKRGLLTEIVFVDANIVAKCVVLRDCFRNFGTDCGSVVFVCAFVCVWSK